MLCHLQVKSLNNKGKIPFVSSADQRINLKETIAIVEQMGTTFQNATMASCIEVYSCGPEDAIKGEANYQGFRFHQ
jgi:hypothetical protein